MDEREISKAEDQARLQDASKCADCKRIWKRFSNDFCPKHSIQGWTTTAPHTLPGSRATKTPGTSRKPVSPATNKGKRQPPKPQRQTRMRSIPKKLGWILGATAVLGGCIAIGNLIPDSWTEETVPTTTTVVRPLVFPNLLNKTFGEAYEIIQGIDPSIEIGYVDVVYNSWAEDEMVVVDQAPPIGASTVGVSLVCLAIVDQDWIRRKREYVMSDNCPKSQSDVLAEKANAWVPAGFEAFTDDKRLGFAFDYTNYDEGNRGIEECTFQGVKGRCSYSRLATKNGCINGAALVVRWLNSLNEVVDLSIFSTSGRVPPGGTFEYVAFLPYSTWDKPVTTVLYQARC